MVGPDDRVTAAGESARWPRSRAAGEAPRPAAPTADPDVAEWRGC